MAPDITRWDDREEGEEAFSSSFHYFAHPHAFSNYRTAPQHCVYCGVVGSTYRGPHVEGEERICEACLLSGRLTPDRPRMNAGHSALLLEQLHERMPDATPDEVQALAEARTIALSYRTPRFVSWQDHAWPAHCGDYCRYLRPVSTADLRTLAPDGDGPAFLATHAEEVSSPEEAAQLWEAMRKTAPRSSADAWSPECYLFRCLQCFHPIILWDRD